MRPGPQIEEETSRTLKRYLAGRRVVDVRGAGRHRRFPPSAPAICATIAAPGDGILARQRDVKPLVELRVPFELDRQQIDDVERGANDSDWQPAKDAAQAASPLPKTARSSRATRPPASAASARAPAIRS